MIKKNLVLVFLLLVSSASLVCAQVSEEWVARYNGPGNGIDLAFAVALDADGNVYVTGYSRGVGTREDYATVKYDSAGNQLWVARYNGPVNFEDYAHAIALDADGNVYVTGGSCVRANFQRCLAFDYATIKYDPAGNELWVARYSGKAYAIALDADGNAYVTGSSQGNYATIKYDSAGNQLWVARYHGPRTFDEAHAIALDADGNVYVTGFSWGGRDYDYATVKYDSDGNELWVARYNGPRALSDDRARAIAVEHVPSLVESDGSRGVAS